MKKITRYVGQLTNKIIPNNPAQSRARHQDDDQVNLPYSSTALPSSSFPTHPGSLILTHSRPKASLMSHVLRRSGKKLTNQHHRCLVDVLPDDVLLIIFVYCVDKIDYGKKVIKSWQILVHVCRRWRIVVFGSPRRLNLRLVCSPGTPARDTLDVWPALPLSIECSYLQKGSLDNIVAVLERSNRVRRIDLNDFSYSDFERVSAAMQVPFPELTHLGLYSGVEMVGVLPDSFLGGSAPRLRSLWFKRIPFPGLPKLLLSATHLVDLDLDNIPHSGYFSPEAMVTALSMLTSITSLLLTFQSPRSRPDRESRHPPPPTRFVLPVLTDFQFKGASEYLEDLVARIDAPRLGGLRITFFNQIIFDTPHFIQFISHTPTLRALEGASFIFEADTSMVKFSSQTSGYKYFKVNIPCIELDWQVSSLEQVFTSCLPPLSTLENLSIYASRGWQANWQDNIENTLWLELLHPFTAVKNLYLSEEFARRIVPALQEFVEGGTTEVLPALQNIFLEGLRLLGPGIGEFVAMRQVIGHPVTVSRWVEVPRKGRPRTPGDGTLSSDPDRLPPQQRTRPTFKISNMVSRGRRLINALHL